MAEEIYVRNMVQDDFNRMTELIKQLGYPSTVIKLKGMAFLNRYLNRFRIYLISNFLSPRVEKEFERM